MLKLFLLLAICMVLAYCSQKSILVVPLTEKFKLDIPFVLIIFLLTCLVGLRTFYDDTYTYIKGFEDAESLRNYIDSDPDLFSNPLYYAFQAFFKYHISNNSHHFLFINAFFSISSMIWFIRKYSVNFSFSILIFFCIGMILVPMSAMKQGIAIGFSLIAIDQMLKKRYILFYLILFIAFLFHAYTIILVVLPLFIGRPWTIFTYFTICVIAFLLITFESTISTILSVSDEVGKNLNEEALLDSQGINLFRLAVFSVPPLLSLFFQDLLNKTYTKEKNLLMHMSILSFLIMGMGIFSAANLFGRSAIYFEIGSIVVLPWIISEMFDRESHNVAHVIVGGCYLAFFAYMVQDFSSAYRAIELMDFIKTFI